MHIDTALTVSGLFLDMVGAFFLGVEAIRLENIQTLKQRVLEKIHSHAQSPRIFFVGDAEHNRKVAALGPRMSETWPPGLFLGLHWIAGGIVLVVIYGIWPNALDLYFDYWSWAINLSWHFAIPLGIGSAFFSVSML